MQHLTVSLILNLRAIKVVSDSNKEYILQIFYFHA